MESNQLPIREINQSILMQDARADLTGRWGTGVAIMLVYLVISLGISFIPFGSVLISGPLSLGFAMMGLGFARGSHVEVSTLFDGFKNFGSALGLALLMGIAIVIGFFLLIVPGIILSTGWGMSMFILADNPEMSVSDVLSASWNLTDGYKFELFILYVKFFLLGLLCILTLGIGFLFLSPYIQTVMAKFYMELKIAKGIDVEEDDDDITKHLVV